MRIFRIYLRNITDVNPRIYGDDNRYCSQRHNSQSLKIRDTTHLKIRKLGYHVHTSIVKFFV